MCVGFSLTTSRALNLMGIPAYRVSGHSGAASHATVRAYYNNAWHTIDTTADGSVYDAEKFNRYRVNRYNLFYNGKKVYDDSTNTRTNTKRHMRIDVGYENWAKEQKTADLVVVNKEAILKHRNTVRISDELRQNLLTRYMELSKNFAQLRTTIVEYKKRLETKGEKVDPALAANIKAIQHSESEITELIKSIREDDRLFLEKYEKYDKKIKNDYNFLDFLITGLKRSVPEINFKVSSQQENELSTEAEELLKKHNLSKEELEKRQQEAERIKREQEEAEKLRKQQEAQRIKDDQKDTKVIQRSSKLVEKVNNNKEKVEEISSNTKDMNVVNRSRKISPETSDKINPIVNVTLLAISLVALIAAKFKSKQN